MVTMNSLNAFEFATATQLVFGRGKIGVVGKAAATMGKKAFILSGVQGSNLAHLTLILQENQVAWDIQHVTGEPSIETVEQGKRVAQEGGCDLVIGIGGGSAIDTGKAVAAMCANAGEVLDYLEVVGSNQPLNQPPLPYIAIPTTAGTGSEVTRNAVIFVSEKKVKVSLRSPLLLPRLAVIDPELTVSLPPFVTASTGMDALAQVIEPFVSIRANALVDLYCREGMKRAARSLFLAYQSGTDLEAREDMAFTSLMGGLSLANAGLGAVHGFAGPVGGMFAAPHGAVCAALLSPVVLVNVRALKSRAPNALALARYTEIAQLVTGRENASIPDLCSWLEDLRLSLEIPGLGKYGIKPEHIGDLVEKSAVASSMKANPIELRPDEMYEILERAL
jgi:alcohol dehydrogenase class IV